MGVSDQEVKDYIENEITTLFQDIVGNDIDMPNCEYPPLEKFFYYDEDGYVISGEIALGRYIPNKYCLLFNLEKMTEYVSDLYCKACNCTYANMENSLLLSRLYMIHELFHVRQDKIEKLDMKHDDRNLEEMDNKMTISYFLEHTTCDNNIKKAILGKFLESSKFKISKTYRDRLKELGLLSDSVDRVLDRYYKKQDEQDIEP